MRIDELLTEVPFQGDGTLQVTDVVCDSRKVTPGCAFVCIDGFVSDGHAFAAQACKMGAAAVIAAKQVDVPCPVILVGNTRKALANMCANLHGNPSRKFRLVGITGTNGKTTTAFLIKTILEEAGQKVGLIGTNQNMIGDEILPSERTTPDAYELQQLFSHMAQKGVDTVVMEVSSHALELDRVAFCDFDVGVFTNITQDHLDFHGTMDRYLKAKSKLFYMCKKGVVNLDDPKSSEIMQGTCSCLTFGIDAAADLQACAIRMEPAGVHFTVKNVPFFLGIPGKFSIYNALGAIGACCQLGVSLETCASGLKKAEGVRGRAQIVDLGTDFTVLIDYAHTPDGLRNILRAVREFAKGRVIVLFGCGGDRDRTKRPVMGQIASQLADFCIITSDNPRTEEPMGIIREILAGVEGSAYTVIENRRDAIRYALEHGEKDDVIVLAGKGHETYQIIGKDVVHFDEVELLHELQNDLKGDGK